GLWCVRCLLVFFTFSSCASLSCRVGWDVCLFYPHIPAEIGTVTCFADFFCARPSPRGVAAGLAVPPRRESPGGAWYNGFPNKRRLLLGCNCLDCRSPVQEKRT